MNTHMKGSFSRWSSRSAQWYEEASQYTNYHNELTKYIAPYLSLEEDCCELACGTGTLARHLAPLTAHYTANDIDPQSIDFCKKMQEQNPVQNLGFTEGDWHTVLKDRTFDTVIFSYFGAIIRDWDALRSLAAKKIIAIVPRYNALEISEKKKATAARSRFADTALAKQTAEQASLQMDGRSSSSETADGASDQKKKSRRFETMDAVSDFLKKQNVPHETIPLTLEFGQPCATLADAEEYVRYYYKFENEEGVRKFIEEKFIPAECGYYFPKKKNIGIVIVDMTKNEI